jgi:hypothetical protein
MKFNQTVSSRLLGSLRGLLGVFLLGLGAIGIQLQLRAQEYSFGNVNPCSPDFKEGYFTDYQVEVRFKNENGTRSGLYIVNRAVEGLIRVAKPKTTIPFTYECSFVSEGNWKMTYTQKNGQPLGKGGTQITENSSRPHVWIDGFGTTMQPADCIDLNLNYYQAADGSRIYVDFRNRAIRSFLEFPGWGKWIECFEDGKVQIYTTRGSPSSTPRTEVESGRYNREEASIELGGKKFIRSSDLIRIKE